MTKGRERRALDSWSISCRSELVIIPPPIQRKHDLVRPYVEQVAIRVRDIVSSLCEAGGYAYLGRTKDVESLAEKVETGRFSSWNDLDDLFACSIVVPMLSDEPAVVEELRASFVEVECKRRGTSRKDPAVFRFDATRFIGRLRPDSVPGGVGNLLGVQFEIQVRSAFEHAWSVTTHALAYKSSQVNWRHMRLAAQLRAAVEQLDQVVLGFEQNAAFISEQHWDDIKARQKIWIFFSNLVESQKLPAEVVPRSWGRFSENFLAIVLATSENRINNIVRRVDAALAMVNREIRSTVPETFPRSVSLLQFCVGALARHGMITGPLFRIVPLITGELLTLYPETRKVGAGFDLQL